MDWRQLLDVGLAALDLNWIDADALTRAMVMFRTGSYESPRELWLDSGLLTEQQTEVLYDRISLHHAFNRALYEEQDGGPVTSSRYMVESTLSEGGMGRILVCVDRALGRRVALKTLRHDLNAPDLARLLAREAKVTGNLEHPSIIPVYDVGVSESDGPYYVMRLVDQPSLEHVLDGLRRRDPDLTAKWSLSRLLRTFVQVCQAIHYAHSHDVIHCDLKPDNILLGAFGEVLVGDWGLAYARGTTMLGGTPAYMAPEQIAATGEYDARTDVFALGVVLYRLLSLRAPFSGSSVSDILRRREADIPPALPSSVAPKDRPIPAELEEIAMQAMAKDPAERYASAQELANAVDSFLEGARDAEQRQRRADQLVTMGNELAERYHEAIEERPKLAVDLSVLGFTVDPWAPISERRRVWDAEDHLAVHDALSVRVLQEAIGSYEQALVEQPGHSAARKGLARLFADQVERARERRADMDRVYFEQLLRQYDDEGILVRAGGRPGWLNIALTGDVDEVVLSTLDEKDRQLVPGNERRLRRASLDAVPSAPGSYLLRLRASGRHLRVPVLVRGDRETIVIVDLDAAGLPREDETFVPLGQAALNQAVSEADGAAGGVQRELPDVIVAPFFIQTFPVTFGRYLEFLEAMLADDPHYAPRLIPSAREGVPLFSIGRHGLVPTAAHADLGMSAEAVPNIPVFGVDAFCVTKFATWWSKKTGLSYRLPSEDEWEKAARGVDGRKYPWGDRFEAVFCKMRFSRPGRPVPEQVGTFASDVSPWGVRDMAGGVAEWCTPVSSRSGITTSEPSISLASRGGAWCDSDADCHITSRRRVHVLERSPRLGFRLVRDGVSPERLATTRTV